MVLCLADTNSVDKRRSHTFKRTLPQMKEASFESPSTVTKKYLWRLDRKEMKSIAILQGETVL
jgi:hypothetical protein